MLGVSTVGSSTSQCGESVRAVNEVVYVHTPCRAPVLFCVCCEHGSFCTYIPHLEPLCFSLEPDSLALLSFHTALCPEPGSLFSYSSVSRTWEYLLGLASYPRLVLHEPGELPFPALVCDCLWAWQPGRGDGKLSSGLIVIV